MNLALLSETDQNGRETRSAWVQRQDAATILRVWKRSGRMQRREITRDGVGGLMGRDYLASCGVLRVFSRSTD